MNIGVAAKVRRVIKFEFEGGHDVEFIPSKILKSPWEVWLDGVLCESLPAGEKPSLARACYYMEVHLPELLKEMDESSSSHQQMGASAH